MKKLLMMIGAAALAVGAYADYEVSPATSSTYTSAAIYTSRAATPTYAYSAGALASPFLVTYKDSETVSVTSPNGVTMQLSGSDGKISYTPTSGGLWTFSNSNGSTAYVGVAWAADLSDGFAPAADTASLGWLETTVEGPNRSAKKGDMPPIAYSDDAFSGADTGTVTLTLTSPSGAETTYTKSAGEDAKTLRLDEAGVWTVELATSSGTSTSQIRVVPSGLIISFH